MTLNPSANPPSCFPQNLFSDHSLETSSRIWWVARTRSRQEKALAWNLYALGIDYFLPLVHRPQKSRNRVRVSVLPLFSGYLFFRGDNMDRQKVLQTKRVAQVIEVTNQNKLYDELLGVHALLLRKKEVELRDFYPEGERVQITHGPLKGLTGTVEKQRNRAFLYLSVECIGMAVRVEIAMEHVIQLC